MGDNKYFKDLGFAVTSIYGIRTLEGKEEFHPGVDLKGKPQCELKAFTDGECVWSGEATKPGTGYGSYGVAVGLKDKNGCIQVYGHLLSTKVKKGDKVKKGQVIGVQGNTGRSFGVARNGYLPGEHLHYEVRKSATISLDPKDKEKRCHIPDDYLVKFFGESEIEMKAETANAIIKYLSEAYKEADKAEQDTIHKLANELRKISGQPLK